ncbi:MAG: DUF2203 domain-containing protein [Actinomycetes bacterium]
MTDSRERTRFTVEAARAVMPELLAHADVVIEVRADLAELAAALSRGEPSPLGGVADAKALEARLHEHLNWFSTTGLELKGWAPLLVDFPSDLGGRDVLLCWLEGERELAWYHPVELGFPGRRRLA